MPTIYKKCINTNCGFQMTREQVEELHPSILCPKCREVCVSEFVVVQENRLRQFDDPPNGEHDYERIPGTVGVASKPVLAVCSTGAKYPGRFYSDGTFSFDNFEDLVNIEDPIGWVFKDG